MIRLYKLNQSNLNYSNEFFLDKNSTIFVDIPENAYIVNIKNSDSTVIISQTKSLKQLVINDDATVVWSEFISGKVSGINALKISSTSSAINVIVTVISIDNVNNFKNKSSLPDPSLSVFKNKIADSDLYVSDGIIWNKLMSLPLIYPKNAPQVVWGGNAISLADITVISGAPTLSIVTDALGRKALQIVTAVNTPAEVQFNSVNGSTFFGSSEILIKGGKADGVNFLTWYVSPVSTFSTQFTYNQATPITGPGANSAEENGDIYTYRMPKVGSASSAHTNASITETGTITYPFTVVANKLKIAVNTGVSATLLVYGIGFEAPKKSRIAVIMDDGYNSWFQRGQPLFDAVNIPVTCAIIPSLVGNGTSCYMRQLQNLVSNGGSVVAHGPNKAGRTNYNIINSFDNNADRVADMNIARDWIKSNGLDTPGYEMCYVWPQGWYQTAWGDMSLLDAAYAAGYTTARSDNGNTGIQLPANFDARPYYQHLALPRIGHSWNTAGTTAGEVTNITNIVNAINDAATKGYDCCIMFHQVVDNSTADGAMPSIGIRQSDLQTIVNAIAANVTAGTQTAVKFPEFAISKNTSFWLDG